MTLRPAALLLALAASSLAWGQSLDPPERIAQLSYVEGDVRFQGADAPATSALPDRPLVPGDRIATARGGRAELALGTAAVRLDGESELSIEALDATTVRVELAAGTASVHVRELYEDEIFEIVTPNTTVAFDAPGEYRVEVSAASASALTVRSGGVATVATVGGPVRVADGQRVELDGPESYASLEAPQPADAFDNWVLDREVQVAEAEPPRYTPYEGEEYEEYEGLDRYGEWYDEPGYGRVWMPAYAYGGYAPFQYGHWQRVGFGWSWVDPFPWGSFTFHHGRWAYLNHLNRWCWVPERRRHHGRHVARETHPFGHPLGDRGDRRRDVRSREVGEDALRRALWRPDPKNERRPFVRTDRNEPRRIDADRRPVFERDVDSAKPSRAAIVARGREDLSRTSSSWRPPSTSRSGAATVRSSSGSSRPSTMAPSRPSSPVSSGSSSSSSRTASRSSSSSSQRGIRHSNSSGSSRSTFAVRPP